MHCGVSIERVVFKVHVLRLCILSSNTFVLGIHCWLSPLFSAFRVIFSNKIYLLYFKVVEVLLANEHIMWVRLWHTRGFMSLTVMYTYQAVWNGQEGNVVQIQLCNRMRATYSLPSTYSLPQGNSVLLLTLKEVSFICVLIPHSSGTRNIDSFLLDFAFSRQLRFATRLHKKPELHSWYAIVMLEGQLSTHWKVLNKCRFSVVQNSLQLVVD